jgi:hypothetical protein
MIKRVTMTAAVLLALSAQPAEASFLKSLIREGAAQLKQAGRQEAQAAVQKAVTAVQQGGGKAAQPGDRQSQLQAGGEPQADVEPTAPAETASRATGQAAVPRR